jgi:hypothetical protein
MESAALAAATFCATGAACDRPALRMLRGARNPHLPATHSARIRTCSAPARRVQSYREYRSVSQLYLRLGRNQPSNRSLEAPDGQ